MATFVQSEWIDAMLSFCPPKGARPRQPAPGSPGCACASAWPLAGLPCGHDQGAMSGLSAAASLTLPSDTLPLPPDNQTCRYTPNPRTHISCPTPLNLLQSTPAVRRSTCSAPVHGGWVARRPRGAESPARVYSSLDQSEN